MTTFPGALPPTGSAVSTNTLAAAGHTALHNNVNDETRAIAAKVGTGASTPTASTVLRGSGTGTSTWGQVNAATDVTGVLPQANGGTGGLTVILAVIYPVGCIYTETTGTNPGTTFGFGTWSAYGSGRVLVGNGTSDQTFAAGSTGGESNHTLSSNEMPVHSHGVTDPGHTHGLILNNGGGSNGLQFSAGSSGAYNAGLTQTVTTGVTINNAGSGSSHNNLQPYIVVYFWQRTA